MPLQGVWSRVPGDYQLYVLGSILALSLLFLLIARFCTRKLPTLDRKQKKQLLEQQDFVTTVVKSKKVVFPAYVHLLIKLCLCSIPSKFVVRSLFSHLCDSVVLKVLLYQKARN